MARRPSKKTKKNPKGPVVAAAPASPAQEPSSGNGPFLKIVAVIVIILGVIYGPSFFSGVAKKTSSAMSGGSFQFDQANPFMLKKVIEFNLNPFPEKTFFVTSITSAGPNRLAVTDCPGCSVLVYDYKGKLVHRWGGKSGSAPTEFKEPSGITNDLRNHLYVLDTWNGAVKVFDFAGKLKQVLDLAHFGFFYGPRWVGWGGNDSLLIPNSPNYHLARLSLKGELVSTWQGKDDVGEPQCAIGDGKGRYYVGTIMDKVGYLKVFDELGKVVHDIKVGTTPTAVALDSKGRIYVECGRDIRVFDADGHLLGALMDQAESGKYLNFTGFYITPDDTILACTGNTAAIYKIAEPSKKS